MSFPNRGISKFKLVNVALAKFTLQYRYIGLLLWKVHKTVVHIYASEAA